jgi:hypothetical protein
MIRVAFFIPNYPDRLSTKKPSSLSLFQSERQNEKNKGALSLSPVRRTRMNEVLPYFIACILASERVAKRFAVNKKDL